MTEETGNRKLERQIERGQFFTHTALSHQSSHINEIESFLYAIVDILVQKGIALPEEITQAVERVRQEMVEKEEMYHPNIALRTDDEQHQIQFIPVNCEERIHICQAVCCQLDFALNVEEVESGKIKWDLGRPYFIRHEKDGYCTHNDSQEKCCNIYNHRPSVCKHYSCAQDERIWKNFEKMELNHEWIDAYINSGQTQPKLID